MVRFSGTSFLEQLCSANDDRGIGRARQAPESNLLVWMVGEYLPGRRGSRHSFASIFPELTNCF
jgi:hypothetical protein